MRTKRVHPYCAIALLTASAACLAPVAGCGSSDDSSDDGDAGSSADGAVPVDGSGGDTSVPHDGALLDGAHLDATGDSTTVEDTGTEDAGVVETSTPDSSDVDAGEDAADGQETDAATDAPVDAALDAGEDAAADAGEDAEADAAPDAEVDAADAAIVDAAPDAVADASDGSVADAGLDAGFSILSPLQVGGIVFNADSVVATATGGASLTPMDGTNIQNGDNHTFPTQAEATALGASGVGLPNNAFFAGDGVNIPPVQLSWMDTANVLNSIVVEGDLGTAFSFNVTPALYAQVQIYATGGNGGSTLDYTLTYSSGAPTTGLSVAIPDWCIPGPLATGTFKLVSVDRVKSAITLDTSIQCSIYAIDLNPDVTRELVSVSFSDTGTSTNYLVFYGATAW